MDLFEDFTKPYSAILVDPPWNTSRRTRKRSPHPSLSMTVDEIEELPVAKLGAPNCHLYIWSPNSRVQDGLKAMESWGFKYATSLIWIRTRRDGEPSSQAGGPFRNATEMILFGVRGEEQITRSANLPLDVIRAPRPKASRRPAEVYRLIQDCSRGPYLELFAHDEIVGWDQWRYETAVADRPSALKS